MRAALLVYVGWLGALRSIGLQTPPTLDNGVRLLAGASVLGTLTVLVYRLGVWRQEMENTRDNVAAEVKAHREESASNFDRMERRLEAIDHLASISSYIRWHSRNSVCTPNRRTRRRWRSGKRTFPRNETARVPWRRPTTRRPHSSETHCGSSRSGQCSLPRATMRSMRRSIGSDARGTRCRRLSTLCIARRLPSCGRDAYDAVIFLGDAGQLHRTAINGAIYTAEFRQELRRRYEIVYSPKQVNDLLKDEQVASLDALIEKSATSVPSQPLPQAKGLASPESWRKAIAANKNP